MTRNDAPVQGPRIEVPVDPDLATEPGQARHFFPVAMYRMVVLDTPNSRPSAAAPWARSRGI